MGQLVKKVEAPAPATPPNEGAVVLGMIDRLIQSPDVPVEKLEQLFALHQKVEADKARKAYFAALADMQPKLPQIEKKAKGHNNKYARWEDIVGVITPILAEFGFALSFRVRNSERGIHITCVCSHREGHSEETGYELPHDAGAGRNAIQAIGSTTSYGKRYTACAILNITTRDEDDDGKTGVGGTITDKQQERLKALAEQTSTHPQSLLALAKVDSFDAIPAGSFGVLEAMLLTKQKQRTTKP